MLLHLIILVLLPKAFGSPINQLDSGSPIDVIDDDLMVVNRVIRDTSEDLVSSGNNVVIRLVVVTDFYFYDYVKVCNPIKMKCFGKNTPALSPLILCV